MRFLQRLHDERFNQNNGDGDPGSDDPLQQLRSEGDRLLAAGDDAIRRAVTGNSEEFLRTSRQQGGE